MMLSREGFKNFNIPHKTYISKSLKVFESIDLENMIVDKMNVSLGAIIGEFDSLYYPTDKEV